MTLRVPGYTPKKRNSGTRKRQAIILISTEGLYTLYICDYTYHPAQ